MRLDKQDKPETTRSYPLQGLKTRASDDPTIALLDAWATVADVLTFYQERIANEGYLRTATERRSVLELAKLVGYQPRPGVASSAYLAYTLDDNFKDETVIPKGARSQSVPGPGELPQSFETSEDLKARAAWNNLKPRMTKPQKITLHDALRITKSYVKGIATNLKANDPLLMIFGDHAGDQVLRLVQEIHTDFANDRTEVTLQETPFLIIAAVDLLRMIVNKLDEEPRPQEEITEVEHNDLRDLLENLSLGNYPPLHETYFSHDRIYRFLKSLNNYNWAFDWLRKYLSSAQILEVAGAVLDQIINTLKDSSFRHDLLCLFRHLLKQALPTNSEDREKLKKLLDVTPRDDDPQKFPPEGPTFSEELRDKARAVLEKLASFLRDPNLHKDFQTLLAELKAMFKETSFQWKFLTGIQNSLNDIRENKTSVECGAGPPITTSLAQLISSASPLTFPPSIQPANSLRLSRNVETGFLSSTDTVPQILIRFQPRLHDTLYQAWANATVKTASPELKSLHALRLTAPLFGHNASVKMKLEPSEQPPNSWVSIPDGDWTAKDAKDEKSNRLYLDNAYDTILPGSYVVIQNNHTGKVMVARADSVTIRPRTAYIISAKTTQIDLSRKWWTAKDRKDMNSLRKTIAHIETEKLPLAMEPDDVHVSGNTVELQDLHGGLVPGRWVIVSGELSNVPATTGVQAAELAMLSAVEQVFDKEWPGDKTHTVIKLASPLAYCFKRETVTIYGNVVKATHGETRKEVLGSGDGAKALQSFALKQPPLTFVSASNPSGVDSTLKVFVNDIRWRETNLLAGLSPTDRHFITKTDDGGKTTVVFGNGREGARLPTGIENIKAEYRNGIGKPGNVKAGQITLLASRPLGVKEVINPLRASGGADKETRDQARKNAPLAVKALDRLVSVQDYEDFARTYAGIGKAHAVEISDGHRQVVHITIAGADDIPIDKYSDLYRNLRLALLDFGDPYQAIQLEIRELMLIVISAGIRILPEYQWEPVVTQVRNALLDAFSFDRRELGQDVLLSEVISVIQSVRGVAYVDVDKLRGVPEKIPDPEKPGQRRLLTHGEIAQRVTGSPTDEDGHALQEKDPLSRIVVNLADSKAGVIRPAQLAFLTPEVPETLILNQIA